jgi:hypothetical protein
MNLLLLLFQSIIPEYYFYLFFLILTVSVHVDRHVISLSSSSSGGSSSKTVTGGRSPPTSSAVDLADVDGNLISSSSSSGNSLCGASRPVSHEQPEEPETSTESLPGCPHASAREVAQARARPLQVEDQPLEAPYGV